MEILQIVGLALTVCCISLLLKGENSLFSFLVMTAGVMIVGGVLLRWAQPIFGLIALLGERYGGESYTCLMKAAGIGLTAQFAQDLCKDAGASALAGGVELGGRMMILLSVLPLVQAVLEEIGRLVG